MCRSLIVAVLLSLSGCKLYEAPRSTGPYTVSETQGQRQTATGDTVAYTLFIPEESGSLSPPPWPAVVLMHGFARSRDFHRNNALYMAQRGLIVLTPNASSLLGGEAARARNAANLVDHVRWLRLRAATPGDPLYGRLDPNRMALAGHSAGGALAFEAAVDLQATGTPVAALLLLDAVPWERTLARAPQFSNSATAIASLRCEPSACNRDGDVLRLLATLATPVEDVLVVGATHCDAENPTDSTCTTFCGGVGEAQQRVIQTLLYHFVRDALNAPVISGEEETYADLKAGLANAGQVRLRVAE